jgi:hypothetical protein
MSANGGGVFPQSPSDLGREALSSGVRGPFFRDDGNAVATVEQDPGGDETGDASPHNENVRR